MPHPSLHSGHTWTLRCRLFFLMRNVIARILLNVHKVESGGWSMLLCHYVMEACPISLRSACLSHVWSAVLLCWNTNTLRIKSDSARDWATHHPSISASFLCKRWLCCVMSGHGPVCPSSATNYLNDGIIQRPISCKNMSMPTLPVA